MLVSPLLDGSTIEMGMNEASRPNKHLFDPIVKGIHTLDGCIKRDYRARRTPKEWGGHISCDDGGYPRFCFACMYKWPGPRCNAYLQSHYMKHTKHLVMIHWVGQYRSESCIRVRADIIWTKD